MTKVAKKKVTKKVAKKAKGEGRKTNYKFDTWLNGKWHTLSAGKDFTCTVKSFVHYAKKRAIVIGHDLEVEYVNDKTVKIKKGGKYTGVQTNPLQTGRNVEKKSTKKKTTKKASKKTTKKKGA